MLRPSVGTMWSPGASSCRSRKPRGTRIDGGTVLYVSAGWAMTRSTSHASHQHVGCAVSFAAPTISIDRQLDGELSKGLARSGFLPSFRLSGSERYEDDRASHLFTHGTASGYLLQRNVVWVSPFSGLAGQRLSKTSTADHTTMLEALPLAHKTVLCF